MNISKIVFITGGARSGKSSFALKEASNISGKKAYIATAEALDGEMRERIENHKRLRGDKWVTYEEPLKITDLVEDIKGKFSIMLIDCLTLWLSNLMKAGLNIEAEIEHFISSLVTPRPRSPASLPGLAPRSGAGREAGQAAKRGRRHSSLVYIVSNEVGMGIVPENEFARRFRDMAGILNQKVSEVSDEVYMVVAGIPVKIKEKYDTGDN
ncbi:MAG: bifunctional adenosylcobinamide kinase/adenosylcobinamide-phosphate guanylyltransferase [Thermodesulfovibrionales bacterium]|nr:bifunctional adenosylcobinamide kinase/adenosylcobinamide-phosphate guanylyltransferase [Thermodesulfovibrionales bacterium]